MRRARRASGAYLASPLTMDSDQQPTTDLERCIHNCQSCHDSCLRTLSYCHFEDREAQFNVPDSGELLESLQDCAKICELNADFMLRGSDFHTSTSLICADICEQCALDCEQFTKNEVLAACSEICRRAAESCRAITHLEAA